LHASDIFVRGGTILPLLLHKNALSLQRAIHNDIKLEVYVRSGKASGMVYMDDGETFAYE
jgi:alpha-glucosidase (family GH31 glycosyl hydrolase)